jgi:hypothetical protein
LSGNGTEFREICYTGSPLQYIKDSFYEELETVVIGCPKDDIKILLGDFTANVGFKDQDRSVVGNCELHKESNNNGLRSTGLARAMWSNL